MKKQVLLAIGVFFVGVLHAQIGVNTQSPKSTLHVSPLKTDDTTAEGIIAPNLTRAQVISKDARYGADQRGALIYVSTINGTVNTKTTKITSVGYYYFDGSVWQPLAEIRTLVLPTEPWQVQGGTTAATGNAENVYQTGSVAIGSNTAGTYKFQVTGPSNVTANSRVASSTVVGNETIGGTLAVTGAATMSNNLTVAGTANLNGATNTKAANISGTLNYKPGGTAPTANTYLRADASGNASWQGLPTTATTEPWRVQGGTTNATTNAQDIYQTGKVAIGTGATAASTYNLEVAGSSYISANSRVGSSTVVGAQTVGGNHTVAGTATLNGTTNAKATNVSGTLNYKPGGTAPTANTYLRTDASGNASWQGLPVTATTEPWRVQGGTTNATTNAQNIYQTGKVAIGTGATAASTYNLEVAGSSYISTNSRVGSSTVVGAQTVGGNHTVAGTATLNGTTNTKATNISGTLNYKPGGTAPAANTYLRTDASGNASWQGLPTTATTEPWQVQGGTTLATTNAQNIYQAGSVHVGANAAVTAYKFQVTGASNVTGNSRVGSLTVAGNETVAGTLGVTGVTNFGSTLAVSGSTGLGTASPAHKLHVVGNEYVSGIAKIGGTTTTNASAQLELADNNKGFLPPRVALVNSKSIEPLSAVVDGMVIYNTSNTYRPGAINFFSVVPGYYYRKGDDWIRLIDRAPYGEVNTLRLQSDITISTVTTNVLAGHKLPFTEITIPEDGSYAFSYRLGGTINTQITTGTPVRMPFYIGIVRNGTIIVDAAEMDIVGVGNQDFSYSVTLGATFSKGDKVTTWMTRNNRNWTLKAASNVSWGPPPTSVVWWRL